MTKIFSIIFLILTGICHAQNNFDASHIRKGILKETNFVKSYSDINKNYFDYAFYKKLKKIKSNEAFELTNHPNAIIRFAALYCMIDNYDVRVFDLLTKNRGDTTSWIYVQRGCLNVPQTFLDEVIYRTNGSSGMEYYIKYPDSIKIQIKEIENIRNKERELYFLEH